MFNVGPLELMVLVIVAIVVVGPDKLPGLARDAARMIRSLRDMATGAREQLRDELGPEFADVDLRNLNPRTALQRVVLGDDLDGVREEWGKFDPRRFDARSAARDMVFGDDEAAGAQKPVSMSKQSANGNSAGARSANGHSANGVRSASRPAGDRPRPRPRPAPSSGSYDSDAT